MNLLARIWVKISLVLAISTLFSCVDPVDVGVQLDPDGIKVDVLFEEIALPSTNMFIDSVRTNNSLSLLVGKYDDPVFGITTSTAYTQFTTNNSFAIRNDSTNAFILDSIILELRVNKYHSNTTTEVQEFFIHQIEDTLFSNVFYLNDFSTPLGSEVIGETSFNFIPTRDTLIKFDLSDRFGGDILETLGNTAVAGIPNIPELLANIRGIGIRAGDNNSALVGFDPNSTDTNMRLYFQIENERDSLFIDFQFNTISVVRYHNTVTDRTSSVVSGATTNFADFETNDGNVYLQPGSGIYPKIDLTPLTDFLNSQADIIINRSQIELGVAPNFQDQDFIDVNQNIRYVFAEDNKNINVAGLANLNRVNTLVLTNASYLSGLADQLVSQYDTTSHQYLGDLTLFTQLLNSGTLAPENLLLMPLDGTTFNQTAIDQDSIRVKLFYTIPKQ